MTMDLANVDPAWAWAPFEPSPRQPWNRALAAHLYRRAGFAATWGQLDEALKRDPAAAVADLFVPAVADAATEAQWDAMADVILASGNSENLSAWWLYRMIHTRRQLLEKVTLFWHGHFATSAAKVTDPRPMLAQHALLRKHSLGPFAPLVHDMCRDPAMLLYLDSATNRKLHPNENYARELMELFCLGVGNYSEKDIQEVARCFTGWEVYGGKFRFNEVQHDYGAKTALGKSGNMDGDDAVKLVLAQKAAPLFIAKKLVKYFICDEPEPPTGLLEPLAREYAERDFDTTQLVRRILASRLFYSEYALARKIRSPVELGVGLVRALEGSTNTQALAADLAFLGQGVFFPPSVKGWDGGRTWINSSTLLGRANLVGRLVRAPEGRFGAGGTLGTLAAARGASGADATVAWLAELLLAVPLPGDVRQSLVAGAQAIDDPNRRVAETVHALATLPEFQIS